MQVPINLRANKTFRNKIIRLHLSDFFNYHRERGKRKKSKIIFNTFCSSSSSYREFRSLSSPLFALCSRSRTEIQIRLINLQSSENYIVFELLALSKAVSFFFFFNTVFVKAEIDRKKKIESLVFLHLKGTLKPITIFTHLDSSSDLIDFITKSFDFLN